MKIVDPFAWSKLTLTDRKSQENPRRGLMCDIAFKIFHVSFWMRKRLPVSWGETTKKTNKQFRTCHWGQMGGLSVVLKFGIAYSKAHPLISEQKKLKLSLMEICTRQKWRTCPAKPCMKGPESFGCRASICSFQGLSWLDPCQFGKKTCSNREPRHRSSAVQQRWKVIKRQSTGTGRWSQVGIPALESMEISGTEKGVFGLAGFRD